MPDTRGFSTVPLLGQTYASSSSLLPGNGGGANVQRGLQRCLIPRRACLLCLALPLSLILTLGIGSHSRFGPFTIQSGCLPQRKIGFLKTHKCASSTVQNILFRYGEHHGLNFVLPLRGNYLGRHHPFDRHLITLAPWHSLGYDIFAMHTMWNTSEVRAVLGDDPSTVLVSILRDPVDLFESLYSFAQWDRLFRMDINQFARAVLINSSRSADFMFVGGYTGHNQMLHDFGLTEADTKNEEIVRQKLAEIEQDFDLIMISEKMDESLVLLKNLMCWDTKDVISLPLNARIPVYKKKLEPRSRDLLKQWLWADQLLYEHFSAVFKAKVEEFGADKLQEEVEELKWLNKQVRQKCKVVAENFSNLNGDFKPSSGRVLGFKVANMDVCKKMARNELAYVEILRLRQLGLARERNLSSVVPTTAISD